MSSSNQMLDGLRIDECLVNTLCFVVTGLLLSDLLLEAKSLLERIVQLRVGVAELLPAHEALETFAQTRARAMVLGQGRHHLRVTDCNGRVSNKLCSKSTSNLPMNAGEIQSGSMNSPTSCHLHQTEGYFDGEFLTHLV